MNILYIDPVFGLSGDMMISALLDAGLPFEELDELYKKIPLPVPAIRPVKRAHGIFEGTGLQIDSSSLHLTIRQMEEIIDQVGETEKVRHDARAMLNILHEAEAKIHGLSKEEVHFHELAHIDTIIDLLGVARGMEYFGVDRVYCGPVPQGRGTLKTAHGIIPNPAPVTLEILSGIKTIFLEESLELTTPTGAAIVKYYAGAQQTAPPFKIEKTGYGVGTYQTDKPDVLRIFIGQADQSFIGENVLVIESDMDDMATEYIGDRADKIKLRNFAGQKER
jgi:pyridinium-3,5-bisthiocarboxylic acid mononucleotide nickel chelatase